MTAREQLASHCQVCGYTPHTLQLIAEAAFADYQPGTRLDDTRVIEIAAAVQTLAQAGRDATMIELTVAHYKTFGEHWRPRFWEAVTRVAALRFNHPELYGLSPLETDPDRLQAWIGVAPVTPAPITTGHATPVAA